MLRFLSLYTGAGGLDYGFEAAGFTSALCVEQDADCCKTIQANRNWNVIRRDITMVPTSEMLEAMALRKGELDLLIGGPPCQPFSKSGYWSNGDARRLRDPRANTLMEYMRCVAETLPSAFVLENVHGIKYSGKEEGFRLIEGLVRRINRERNVRYRLHWSVLNAVDYGVPQLRSRFVLVGNRTDNDFIFPSPVTTPNLGNAHEVVEATTAWDAIGHLRHEESEDLSVKGAWADLLPSIPEGKNYLWHTNRGGGLPLFGWRTRYWNFLLKLAKNLPSWTIQAQPGPAVGPFHWESRRLSVVELAALQTFPADIKFYGSRISVQRQIGNAVPSLLGESLARAVASQIFNAETPSKLAYAVPFHRPIPPPEPLGQVPERFLRLAGDHPDHPGEGRGRLYSRQAPNIAI